MKVYLDNGATTKTDPKVVEFMIKYFTDVYGNASSLHDFGSAARKALGEARTIIAKSLNALPEEIIFTASGSESDNLAIKGVAYALKNKNQGNHIITSKIEHPAVLETCKFLENNGFKVTYLDVDNNGFVDLDQLQKSITEKTILITIMHANNEIGVIQDIKKIGDIAKKNNIIFHTDAVQSYTKVPIDVKKINVDLISISSHKIHGPKGVGALYIKKGTLIQKQIHGGHHEFDLRAGTENIAGIVGFAKAVELSKNIDLDKIKRLRDYLIDRILKEIPDTNLNGDKEKRLVNNANISFKGVEGEGILLHLNAKGIAVSTGSACSSQSLKPSHVLVALGMKHEDAHSSIRFTLSKYTTRKEIDYTVDNLKEIVASLRKLSPLYNTQNIRQMK